MSSNTSLQSKPSLVRKSPVKGLKDETLHRLGASHNVAQFVSFASDLRPRFARVLGRDGSWLPRDLETAVAELFPKSPESSLNVRTFLPDNPQTTGFAYGIKSADEVVATVRKFAAEGLFTIVNETVDVKDGGVSGVVLGDLVEFAPGDTPRCVEKPGCAALSREWGRRILKTVYGFEPPFGLSPDLRLEFTLHPLRRGCRHEHVIVWEASHEDASGISADPRWPNRFSTFIGDKAYGLLVADAAGLPVPRAVVIPRRTAPFSFGRDTGCAEIWLRTAPNEQTPGKFTTTRGWTDPYRLTAAEDPEGTALGAILAQAGVDARWSGAAITGASGELIIEGKAGFGDDFMVGRSLPEAVDPAVLARVEALYAQARAALGAVRFEWVDDGSMTWIVQFHRGATASSRTAIFEGEAQEWHDLDAAVGLEAIRAFVAGLDPAKDGIRLHGRVGLTSHIADVIRKAKVPTRLAGG